MARERIALNNFATHADQWASEAKSPEVVAINGVISGVLTEDDLIKPEVAELVSNLVQTGIQVAMITGDTIHTANSVVRKLGLDKVMLASCLTTRPMPWQT